MNKTLTINISGIVFHIEEDAYLKLDTYIYTLKNYFVKLEGGNEIVSDIESRIAEMLQARLSNSKQVVVMSDVDTVIDTMGKPEEFTGEPIEEKIAEHKQEYTTHHTEQQKKRLFRDPDHKAIGGVCSGIANYFDVDIVWVRLAMVLLVFFWGMSIWVYLILWMAIPEAKTTAEKLAMRGEKIDINTISKTVKEEAEQLKKRVEKYGNDLKSNSGNLQQQSRNFFEKLGDFIKDILGFVIKFFSVIIGIFLLFVGSVFMLGLLSVILGVSVVGSHKINDWITILFVNSGDYGLGILSLVLVVGIPIIMMIYGGIKLLFRIKYNNKLLNVVTSITWLIGLILLMYVSIKTASDFSETAKVRESLSIEQHDTLYLSMNKNFNYVKQYEEEEGHIFKIQTQKYIIDSENKQTLYGKAELSIVPSKTSEFEITIVKRAKGIDKIIATDRANKIHYKFQQTDSVLNFDEFFEVNNIDKFRMQEVQVILRVPIGKVIYLDASLKDFIYDIENIQNTYDDDMVSRRWKMTETGLTCVDCDGLDDDKYETKKQEINVKEGIVNIDTKDGKVNIDVNGVKVNTEDAKIEIGENGINIKTEK